MPKKTQTQADGNDEDNPCLKKETLKRIQGEMKTELKTQQPNQKIQGKSLQLEQKTIRTER